MTRKIEIIRVAGTAQPQPALDDVAIEAPLEIRVEGHVVAVAMRTPGHDRELAAGWALAEGIVRSREEIADVVCRPGDETGRDAMVDVMLAKSGSFLPERHRRNVLTNASCGLCGAASVDQILRDFSRIDTLFRADASLLQLLPDRLRAEQTTFQRTGGVHACALFDATGSLLTVREDVGRHNALDKLTGWALLAGTLPLSEHILLLSGRISLEMVQKALAAGIPMVAAIGAPTSLAVDLAQRSGICLAGFLRGASFNVYAGMERLRGAGSL